MQSNKGRVKETGDTENLGTKNPGANWIVFTRVPMLLLIGKLARSKMLAQKPEPVKMIFRLRGRPNQRAIDTNVGE